MFLNKSRLFYCRCYNGNHKSKLCQPFWKILLKPSFKDEFHQTVLWKSEENKNVHNISWRVCTEEAMFVKAVSSEEVTDNSQWMKISLNTADYKSMEDCLYHNLYHFCPGQNVQRKYSYPFSPGNVQTWLCSSFLAPLIPSLQRASNSHFVLHFYPLLPVEHLAHKMLLHFCLW